MPMVELLRILLSRETRETVHRVVKLIARRSPEWKKDLVVVEGKFSPRQREQSRVLLNYLIQLLAAKRWDDEAIQRARFVLLELVRNAFEHGLGQKPKRRLHVRAEVSSDFLKADVTDPGSGFDLAAELEQQGAKDRYSNKCRALGFIYRMVTDLSQNVSGHGHTVSVTLEKAYSPCEVERAENITFFGFKGEIQPHGYFWAEIVREIQELPPNSRVILDFTDVDDMSTRVLSEIFRLLAQYGWMEQPQAYHGPGPKDFLATLGEGREGAASVVVCGCDSVNYVLRDFLRTRFKVFPDRKHALEYLSGRPKAPDRPQ